MRVGRAAKICEQGCWGQGGEPELTHLTAQLHAGARSTAVVQSTGASLAQSTAVLRNHTLYIIVRTTAHLPRKACRQALQQGAAPRLLGIRAMAQHNAQGADLQCRRWAEETPGDQAWQQASSTCCTCWRSMPAHSPAHLGRIQVIRRHRQQALHRLVLPRQLQLGGGSKQSTAIRVAEGLRQDIIVVPYQL